MNQAPEFKLLGPTNNTIPLKIIIIIIPNNYCWICSFVIRNCYILPICFQATSWDPNVDFAEDDVMEMLLKTIQCTI